MQCSYPRLFMRSALTLLLTIPSVLATDFVFRPAHAAGGTASALAAFVGYAEDKETNTPNPAAFPVPWAGAPNTIFLGGPVVGQTACHALLQCFDAGAIRLDNGGTSDVTVDSVAVNVRASLAGGKLFNLWGSFTIPAGKSAILTENPPGNNPSYDNFDTSGYPKNNCTPISAAPIITITIGGVSSVLVDSTHVLDTGGIDVGSCSPHMNESIQWRPIGAAGLNTASLTLGPTMANQTVGQQVIETASLLDGSGAGLPNVAVNFTVTNGPNAGLSGRALTGPTGQASFPYIGAAPGMDTIVASVTSVGVFSSTQTSVTWTAAATTPAATTPAATVTPTSIAATVTPTSIAATCPAGWSCADIGSPALVGSQSLSNGIWTVAGSGRDIGGTADQFHFVWQPLTGAGGIRAQALSQTNTNSRARAGVMLRASTDPSAPFYAVVVTPQRGLFVLKRATQGGGVSTVVNPAGTVPVYLQVARAGDVFTAYTSSDGMTWTPIAGSSVTLNLTGTLLAGMAVTAHDVTKVSTATFGTVSSP